MDVLKTNILPYAGAEKNDKKCVIPQSNFENIYAKILLK